MAHELDRTGFLIGEVLQERDEGLDPDRAGVLVLAHEAIGGANAGVAKPRALPAVVRAQHCAGLLRELEHGVLERAQVVDPVMGVEVRGLAPDELARAHTAPAPRPAPRRTAAGPCAADRPPAGTRRWGSPATRCGPAR